MRVAYVTMAFPHPSEAFATTELRAVGRHGVKISVLTMRARPPDERTVLAREGLSHLETSHNSMTSLLRGLGGALRRPFVSLWLLYRILRDCAHQPNLLFRSLVLLPRAIDIGTRLITESPEVLHLFWGHYPSLVGLFVKRAVPDRLISLFLGTYDLDIQYGCSRTMAGLADVIWTHAKANRSDLERLGVCMDRVRIMYRGVDLSRVSAGTLEKEETSIVSVGRLIPEKGMDEVLRIFQTVKRVHPSARLAILGGGPEEDHLKAQADELGLGTEVEITGHIPQEQVLERVRDAQVILLMSRLQAERLPNTLKEAMQFGTIPITTATLGIEELVIDGECGFVVEQRDEAAAADAIIKLFDDRALQRRLQTAAQKIIRENFDVDRITRVQVDTWSQLLTSRRSIYEP